MPNPPRLEGLKNYAVVSRESDAVSQPVTDQVAEETAVAVTFNGITHAVMMASPSNLHDFVIGFAITEGIIDQPQDIHSIDIETGKQGIAIQTRIPAALVKRLAARQRSLAGRAGCGICGLTDIAAAVPKLSALKPQAAPNHAAVDKAAHAIQAQQVLQQACGGIHGAALCNRSGELLLVREDVGRHNALDKLIGAAFQAAQTRTNDSAPKFDSPFAEGDFILMSSRASHELINKCVVVGIGSLVTLSAATSLAIDVASQTRLNLIGFVRGHRQLVYYSNP